MFILIFLAIHCLIWVAFSYAFRGKLNLDKRGKMHLDNDIPLFLDKILSEKEGFLLIMILITILTTMNKDELITERLLLRKLKKDDVESIFYNWASDPEVSRYVTWPTHDNIEQTQQILDFWLKEYENPKTIRYGIVVKETGELIGAIDVVDYVDDNPEIGYCLSRKHWNKGYMSEACSALVEHLFAIGYQTIVIEADEDNIGSNRVITKCGFEFTHKETKQCSSLKPDVITVNWYKKSK